MFTNCDADNLPWIVCFVIVSRQVGNALRLFCAEVVPHSGPHPFQQIPQRSVNYSVCACFFFIQVLRVTSVLQDRAWVSSFSESQLHTSVHLKVEMQTTIALKPSRGSESCQQKVKVQVLCIKPAYQSDRHLKFYQLLHLFKAVVTMKVDETIETPEVKICELA